MHSFPPSIPNTVLARLLVRWCPVTVESQRQNVAERLGHWLSLQQAIELHTARATDAQAAVACRPDSAHTIGLRTSLQADLQRVRTLLAQSIRRRDAAHPPDPNDSDTEWSIFLRRFNEQQQRMEQSVGALRLGVREQLAQAGPTTARLAVLDAQTDRLFGIREQRLLGGLTGWLKARFTALQQGACTSGASTCLDWLRVFENDFEQLLLAELDLRLQPITSLIESLDT